jgi:hypothetical protein
VRRDTSVPLAGGVFSLTPAGRLVGTVRADARATS